ncbi:MAG: MFS transporter [Planctomycetes bacterium]|nr:MFS transporter [Planctomycetota bacterium]
MLRVRSLICLALIHSLVDSYAQVVAPLWPLLQKEFALDPWSLTLLFAAWQLATSISQPLFGYWSDRFGGRWMLALGPALAVTCISLLGFATGAVGLFVLLVAGGLGIGAFHPEAAAEVMDCSGTKPTTGLAVFTFGGMLGLGIGPVVSGILAGQCGLAGLALALPPGMVLLGGLLLLHRSSALRVPAATNRVGLAEIVGGQWLGIIIFLTVATLRVVPVLGIPLGLAFLLDQQGRSVAEIGWSQSLFLLSGGVGTLLCPLWARPGRELTALVMTMFPAACCLFFVACDMVWMYHVGLVGSGLLLQGAFPILIAYSQRLLPRGRRLAASLTLGASWGLGGLIVAGLQAYFTATGQVEGMFWALVPFAVAAGLGSCFLPRRLAFAGELATVPIRLEEQTSEPGVPL